MKIQSKKVTPWEIYQKFKDKGQKGVIGYDNKLDIRPEYQREFVYEEKDQKEVIDSVLNDVPLNAMYWVKKDNIDEWEVLDGQQRTLSIMYFMDGKYTVDINGHPKYYTELDKALQQKINQFELMIYEIVNGTPAEKLHLFEKVNTLGKRLEKQELRNAAHTGKWLSSAKEKFSYKGCQAEKLYGDNKLFSVDIERQDLLEVALKGIAEKQNTTIEAYMSKMANDKTVKDANELYQYFYDVVAWVNKVFDFNNNYRPAMRSVDWCDLYNRYNQNTYNSADIEKEVDKLMNDPEVGKKSGIYEFVLVDKTKDKDAGRFLSLRAFDKKDMQTAYNKQKGICPVCGNHFKFEEMAGDHKKPWSKGGKTEISNLQMLCRDCNLKKSNKY